MLAWLKVILAPIQNLWKRIFVDYKDGSLYADYDAFTVYVFGDRVVYTNKSVYECIRDTMAIGIPCDNTDYWLKINDNFIGASERAKYNAQKIVFEYALNKWFRVPSGDPQIYIVNHIVSTSAFVMGATGAYSSAMASSSAFSTSYMGASYSAVAVYDYTIYVPVAVFNAQGSTTTNRENAIRNFADKYNLIGMSYSVVTY
jgi:hypothetical protein